jgi:hypothetical protein
MSPRGETLEGNIATESTPTDVEHDPTAGLSSEGLVIAAKRVGIPPETATWREVMAALNARAKRDGQPEDYDERKKLYLEERAVAEGLDPSASEKEILQARLTRLRKISEHTGDLEQEVPSVAA